MAMKRTLATFALGLALAVFAETAIAQVVVIAPSAGTVVCETRRQEFVDRGALEEPAGDPDHPWVRGDRRLSSVRVGGLGIVDVRDSVVGADDFGAMRDRYLTDDRLRVPADITSFIDGELVEVHLEL